MSWNPDELRRMVDKEMEIPPLPMVAQKALKAIDAEDADVASVASILQQDAAFATQVLKVANSARYAGAGQVNDVHRAAARLGLKNLKNLVLVAANRTVYRRFGPLERELWMHSLGVGIAAEKIAEQVAPELAHDAFAAGMLHDVGKVIMDNASAVRFKNVSERARKEQRPSADCEREEFGFDHTQVGFFAAGVWTLSQSIRKTILRHHDPERIQHDDIGEASVRTLCSIVCAADRFAHALGLGLRDGPEEIDLASALGVQQAGIVGAYVGLMKTRIQDAYDAAAGDFA